MLKLSYALTFRDLGFSVGPTMEGTKKPAMAWKGLTKNKATREDLGRWFKPREENKHGIFLVTGRISGFIVVDVDNRKRARQIYNALPRTEMMSLTPSGVHFLYRLPSGTKVRPAVKKRIKGIVVDIRADDSYIVAPPSRHPSGSRYELLGNWTSAPEFDPDWIEPSPKPTRSCGVRHVAAYLQKVLSLQGKNGSAALVRAAAICRDAGLSESQATVELLEWNREPTVCPPWSASELTRAITRVYAGDIK